MNRLRFSYIRKQRHFFRSSNHIQPLYLSKLSFFKTSQSIFNHTHQHHQIINSKSYLFCTSSKDDNKKDATTDNPTSTESTPSNTDSSPPSTTESSSNSSSTTSTVTKESPQRHVPMIRIHDETKPQLSIQLPNRWPFKRLARDPVQEPEPLNMHQMTTFSGLPAQNFMPTEADKLKAEKHKFEESKKSAKEKKRDERMHFWKRFTLLISLTPLLLYVWDNRKAKKLAKKRAQYISSACSDDARLIRDMVKLNNSQLMDFYKWILNEECDNNPNHSMSIDKFGEVFVNAVKIFKQRNNSNGDNDLKAIRLSREYDEALTERQKKRELKWLSKKYETVSDKRLSSKSKEIQAWDLNIFFSEYNTTYSNKIPLHILFIAISQITSDPLYIKAEIAFRIKGQCIDDAEARLTYKDTIELIEDMIITGHFTTDSLIVRKKYFPSQWGIRTAKEIVDLLYNVTDINHDKDITFTQFGDAINKIREGRKWYESVIGFFLPDNYKPFIQAWYISDRSHNEINAAKRDEQKKIEKEEKKKKKRMEQLEKQTEHRPIDNDINTDIKSDGVEVQHIKMS